MLWFVAVGHACAAEDCYSIHNFLWTAKLLESVAQHDIRWRSIIHTSLVRVTCRLLQAGTGAEVEVGQLISILLLPLYLHYTLLAMQALEFYVLSAFPMQKPAIRSHKSGQESFCAKMGQLILTFISTTAANNCFTTSSTSGSFPHYLYIPKERLALPLSFNLPTIQTLA